MTDIQTAAERERDQVGAELADLRNRFAALAALEEYIGESCDNAAHNIRNVLDGSYDPRPDADRYALDYRGDRSRDNELSNS